MIFLLIMCSFYMSMQIAPLSKCCSQISDWKGFSPEWVRAWRSKVFWVDKTFPQTSQKKSLCTYWLFWCLFIWWIVLKDFPHILHSCIFSLFSRAFTSCTVGQISIGRVLKIFRMQTYIRQLPVLIRLSFLLLRGVMQYVK